MNTLHFPAGARHARDTFHTRARPAPVIAFLRSPAFILLLGLLSLLLSPNLYADITTQPDIRELDRLFTTKYERAQLDAQRRRMQSGEGIEAPANNNVSAAPVNVEMQGIMQREKGGNVAWINGQSTLNSNTIDDNIRVKGQPKALSGANVSIGGQTVRLKPGQVWQPENGKVEELYRTKVAAPVTKGADEADTDVQTGKSDSNQAASQPPVKQP